MRELYEADFRKPGIYGSGRVWSNVWDVFPRMQSRVRRGRRLLLISWCVLGGADFFSVFFFSDFFFLNTHGLLQV